MWSKIVAALSVLRVVLRTIDPTFREVLALAGREVRARDLQDAPGETKRLQALAALKTATAHRGLAVSDWLLNLALEVAVAAVKAGLAKLLGTPAPTVRMAGAVLVVILAATAAGAACVGPNSTCVPSRGDVCCAGNACLGPDRQPLPPTSTKGGACKPWPGTTPTTIAGPTTTTPTTTTTSSTRPPCLQPPIERGQQCGQRGQPETWHCCVTPGDACLPLPQSGGDVGHMTCRASTTTTTTSSSTSTTRSSPPTPTTTLPPSTPVVIGVCRPSARDVGRGLPDSWLRYAGMGGLPHVASQQERDCMEWEAFDRVTELVNLFKGSGLADNAVKKGRGCQTLVLTRLGAVPPYEGALIFDPNGGVWIINDRGRHYQCEQDTFDEFYKELTSNKSRAVAMVVLADKPDLRDLLYVNLTLDGDPDWRYPTEKELPKFDSKRASAFPVDTRQQVPPCFTGDCSLLHATHEAHACITQERLKPDGQGRESNCGSVSLAHFAYEAQCAGDERCQVFRRMKKFRGDRDFKYSKLERDRTEVYRDRMHQCWMAAQEAGDPRQSRVCDGQHLTGHIAGGDKAPDRRYVVVDQRLKAKDFGNSFGGDQTWDALLPKIAPVFALDGGVPNAQATGIDAGVGEIAGEGAR